MHTDLALRIDAFWQWIEYNSDRLLVALRDANATSDLDTLNALVSVVYGKTSEISDDLIVDVHLAPDAITLALRTTIGDYALAAAVLARAPALPGWRFAQEIPRDLEKILVRDESGREIVVPYAALRFALLDEDSPGEYSVVIVFEGDFDVAGRDAHLWEDAATHALTTLLGRLPTAVATYTILPARLATEIATRPILELPNVWSALASRRPSR